MSKKRKKWIMQNWNTVSFVNPYTNIGSEIVSISIDKKLTVYEAETRRKEKYKKNGN